MILNKISILNFKNIREATLDLSPKMNCFLGHNGEGKTNFLDAVYYLSFCRIRPILSIRRLSRMARISLFLTDGMRMSRATLLISIAAEAWHQEALQARQERV